MRRVEQGVFWTFLAGLTVTIYRDEDKICFDNDGRMVAHMQWDGEQYIHRIARSLIMK